MEKASLDVRPVGERSAGRAPEEERALLLL